MYRGREAEVVRQRSSGSYVIRLADTGRNKEVDGADLELMEQQAAARGGGQSVWDHRQLRRGT